MRTSGIEISFIIVDYNAFLSLQRLMETIRKKTKDISYEIIVVDNSKDTKESFFQKNHPDIKYIFNSKNLGFSKAANIGINNSAGQYVLLLNPDTRLKNNVAMLLAGFLDKHPDVGVAGAKILNDDESIQFSCRSFPSYKTAFFNRYSLLTRMFPKNRYSTAYINPINSHNETAGVDWLSGSCMMLRKQALESTGLFDENFFMYCEDVDICHRMKLLGWKVVYYPEAVIYHSIGKSSSQNKIKAVVERHKSMWTYYKKYLHRRKATDIIIRFGIVSRCIFHLIIALFQCPFVE
ncbi:glycosyltransferase family 2 protein [Candidatus Kuenenia sp.]|uniref:glycosyltransferase family 2 protein n=1 Tax=Candidatus Kuenenia sp. TaxID=2499824 RepID=UPI0032200DCA